MSAAGDLAAALRWHPDSGKARFLATGLLAVFAVYGIVDLAVCAARGWPHGFGDAFAIWSWGRFLHDHPAAAIYDPATLRAAQLALGLDPGASYPFIYPPSYLPVLWLLGQMPGPIAGAVLIAVSLPLYLWSTVGTKWRSSALLAALAAPTTTIVIAAGQSGFLTAAVLAGGLRLVPANPATAGVLFGLLSYKPQLGLLVPVALVAARRWRALAAASVTAVLLVILTTAVFGRAVWPSWAAAIPVYSRQFATESSEIRHLMPTIFAALSQLSVPPAIAQWAQWAVALVAAAAVWVLFRPSAGLLAGAGLLVAALLATPYAFVYDMPILATAVIWLVAERQRGGDAFGAGEVVVMMLAMIAPISLVAGSSRLPLAALSLLLLLAAIVRRAYQLSTTDTYRIPAAAALPSPIDSGGSA